MMWIWIIVAVVVIATLVFAFGTSKLPSLPSGTATTTKTWFGANWKFLVVVIGLGLWGKSCYDSSKAYSEAKARAASAAQHQRENPEVRLTAYPNRVSEKVNPWGKFGSGAKYEIARSGNVWVYVNGKTNTGVLATPSNTIDVGSPWTLSFRSAETNPVEVIIRKK